MTPHEQAGNARNSRSDDATGKPAARSVLAPDVDRLHRRMIDNAAPVPRARRHIDDITSDERIEAQFDNLPV